MFRYTTQTSGQQVLGTFEALVVRKPKSAAQQQDDVDAIRSETATSAFADAPRCIAEDALECFRT